MKKYGVTVVGTEWVSGKHIRASEVTERAQVTAIISCSQEEGETKMWGYGLEGRCKVYIDYQEGLKDPNVDIVVIRTPSDIHCRQTILATETGKHILIEKPAALTWEDTKRMGEAVCKTRVKTLVGYVLHYSPLFITARKVQKDLIGKPRYVETGRSRRAMGDIPRYQWTRKKSVGGSFLSADGCHATGTMWWSMQDEMVPVYAQSNKMRTDLEFDSTISITLKSKNGVVGKVSSSYDLISPYAFDLHLCSTKGTLWDEKLWSPSQIAERRNYMKLPMLTPDSGNVKYHPFPEEATHFLDCIVHDRETDCPTSDVVKTQEIVSTADSSTATGEIIHLSLK